jgi:very-short-patch-repair endonuclease
VIKLIDNSKFKMNLTPIAKKLRKSSTEAENRLWRRLRARQMAGFKFRRQQPIGRYVVDFVSFEGKLIVELDGGQHKAQELQDRERDEWLGSRGYSVLRFWNNEVFENLEAVLEVIRRGLVSPSPSPSRQGRGADCGGW